jgi:hypothetical protein
MAWLAKLTPVQYVSPNRSLGSHNEPACGSTFSTTTDRYITNWVSMNFSARWRRFSGLHLVPRGLEGEESLPRTASSRLPDLL